ncbi:type I glyceraldehyde-3-phosphate dehydrogenase [Dehalogenimonas alkenigignens]|uniref:Glyceraldehyde-3-phosphate dehydrogenase (NAD+) n=1 Tax=Dehalogenimonas alkenigignens TaxID=1217799 RepID=A0A0W0GIT4_9CHLR|nr:type I glyceraldehyde-3-phosphate dehydrogenase [Dehalogenimonas alkenigignens]KTB48469.1 glyceraldehyde-3-phosphate dehydrogenase (NAD+) [Dehalogenimonas alkenigignens]PVV85080.1 type I glyceraldehyde-3-phosphate dehydrogenase [Dehalogenimonas alkenigignens]
MVTRIGINGFGRIGRLTFRAMKKYHANELEVVAINDLADTATNAHLLKHDTSYGAYPGTVEAGEGIITVDGKTVRAFSEKEPNRIPWSDYGVDIVIESTGRFSDRAKAALHLEGGAKKVIISTTSANADLTVVMGVNEKAYKPADHAVISNASCTTNCVTPMVKVINDKFGIEKALINTVHAYTNDQSLLDIYHKDLRRARAAALNIIPTTTGAAKAVAQVIPELKGLIHGISLRVPVGSVSIADLTAIVKRNVTAEEVNAALEEAAGGGLKGVLTFCKEELVSSDFKGDPASCIIDAPCTMVMAGNMVKVLGWYDNEWGYSTRLGDLAAFMGRIGLG